MIPTLSPVVTPLPRPPLSSARRVTVANGGVQVTVWPSPVVGRATVVLVAGVGWHAGYLGTVAAELHARGLHVLALDPPGQGRSVAVHGSAYVETTLRALRETRSLGGPAVMVGVGLGLLASDLVTHALLAGVMDAAAVHGALLPQALALPGRWRVLRAATAVLPQRVPVPLHKAWSWATVFLDPEVLSTRMRDQACGWSPRAGTLRALLAHRGPVPAAGNESPCLVLGAERDEVTTPAHALGAFQALGGPKSLVVMADAGHDLTARFAPALADVLSGFVDDVRARQRKPSVTSGPGLPTVRHTPRVAKVHTPHDLRVPPTTPPS